jgi:diketogulonate reductase-like aldo/keto reductase
MSRAGPPTATTVRAALTTGLRVKDLFDTAQTYGEAMQRAARSIEMRERRTP